MRQRNKKTTKAIMQSSFRDGFCDIKHVISEINRFYELIFLQRLYASYLAIPGPSVQEYKIYFDM